MSKNDFEKQVRKKMDELSFTPSEPVWSEIEKNIRKRKDRRRLLFWLFLGLLLGGGTWIYTYNIPAHGIAHTEKSILPVPVNSNNNSNIAPANNTSKKATQPARQEDASSVTKKKNELRASIDVTVNATPATEKNKTFITPHKIVATNNSIKEQDNNVVLSKKQRAYTAQASADDITKRKGVQHAYQQKTNLPIINNNKRDLVATSKGRKDVTTENATAINQDPLTKSVETAQKKQQEDNNIAAVVTPPADNKMDSAVANNPKPVTDTSATKQPIAITAGKDSTVVAKKKTSPGKKKIQWGISAGAGISGISNGLFSDNKSYAAANSITNGGNYTPGIVRPSDVKQGASFSVGLIIRKPLGATYSLLTGLQYNYYSTHIEVGNKVDRTTSITQNTPTGFVNRDVASYYTSVSINQQPYTNNYHYIELPVLIEKQLGNKSRFSIDAGISVSQFLGSNALHYDASRTIYYKDNALFNKTQLNLLAGVSWRFLQRKNFSLSVSPNIKYGATNFLNKDVYDNKHLFVAGVGMQLFFGKK